MMKKRLFTLAAAAVFSVCCILPRWTASCVIDVLPAEAADSPIFEIVDGTYLAHYNGTEETEITVPDGIETIGSMCFAAHAELQSVTLPESVTEIEMNAFLHCTALTQINIPDSVQKIGTGVFMYCTSLKEVTLPAALDALSDYLFFQCSTLQTVRTGGQIQTLGAWCFYQCNALTELHLGEHVVSIAANAFGDPGLIDDALLEAYTAENGLTLLDDRYLIAYSGSEIQLVIPDGTRLMADGALAEQSFYTVTCPDSLLYIGKAAFQKCGQLFELNLNDGLLSIGENALSGCQYLTALNIPASVTEIGTQENLYLTDIYGTPGTAAEVFANENGIAFHDVAGQQLSGKDMSIIYGTDTWSIHNAGYDFNSEYYLTDAARRQLESAMSVYQEQLDEVWSGECFGLAIGLILVKAGVYTPSQMQTGAETLSQVTSDQAVQSFINYFHFMQFSDELLALSTQSKIEAQMMYTIIQSAKAVPNGGLPFLISMTFSDGGHAVVGYGQEEGTWEFDGITYDGRILIWDPNFPTAPNEDTYIYYDSSTFAYCIPYYKAQVDAGANGVIKRVCNDISVLNAHPYPFEQTSDIKGDVNCDGDVTLADAVLLAIAGSK